MRSDRINRLCSKRSLPTSPRTPMTRKRSTVGCYRSVRLKRLGEVPSGWRDFTGLNGWDFDFSDSNLNNASFRSNRMSQTSFAKAELRQADFSEAEVMSGNFANADLTGAVMINAVFLLG